MPDPTQADKPSPAKLYPPVPFDSETSPVSEWYGRHLSAMTAEGLHDKSDIAWQLATRDAALAERDKTIRELRELLRDASNRLGSHHDSTFWDENHAARHGYKCPICNKPGEPTIFILIAAATPETP